MSNLLLPPTLRTIAAGALCAGLLAAGCTSSARGEPNPIEAYAEFVTRPKPYRGKTVPFPDPVPRPVLDGARVCSERAPLCVHAPRDLPPARVARALAALETSYSQLAAERWPLPYPDLGPGGSLDFDVYLARGSMQPARALAEQPLMQGTPSELDAATTYAVLDADLPGAALEPCALSALVQAGLLARDPAESEGARRQSALYAQWQSGFDFASACEAVLEDSQRAPELGFLGDDERQLTAGALYLTMLSRRHDGGSGRFVRGLWELARQRSESPNALHAKPDLRLALAGALERAGEALDDSAEEFAVARYLAPERNGPLPPLPASARVPLRRQFALATLPKQVAAGEPGLATYGSAYVRVDTRGATDGTQLQIWLRGERDVRWSLIALREGADGAELGRMRAPPRKLTESFLPVVLTADTAAVVIVVTALPATTLTPQAGGEDDRHYFKLVLDQQRP